jgi:hypothetical protein
MRHVVGDTDRESALRLRLLELVETVLAIAGSKSFEDKP